jgi:hypothetical protein
MNMNGTDLTLAGVAALWALDQTPQGYRREIALASLIGAVVLRRAWQIHHSKQQFGRDPAKKVLKTDYSEPCIEYVDYLRIYRPEEIKDAAAMYGIYAEPDSQMVRSCEAALFEMLKEDSRNRGIGWRDLQNQFRQRAYDYKMPSALLKGGQRDRLNPAQLAAQGRVPDAVIAESRRINATPRLTISTKPV